MRVGANTRRLALAAAAALVVGTGAVTANAADGGGAGHRHATPKAIKVALHAVDGTRVGEVKLKQERGQVVVTGVVHGLAPGFHGFHIHAVGLCEADAPNGPFTTAGGHFTRGTQKHSDHSGDMPSLLVTAEGYAYSSFVTDRFGLADLRDADGSAVMVHAGPDNFANIPTRYSPSGPDSTTQATGDAGARAACGVID